MSGLQTFKMLHKQFSEQLESNGKNYWSAYGGSEMGVMLLYVLGEAHQMMRDGKITKEEFAECMDEAMCW